jgi:hypothetical protein
MSVRRHSFAGDYMSASYKPQMHFINVGSARFKRGSRFRSPFGWRQYGPRNVSLEFRVWNEWLKEKKEDEICTSSFSSSTIPLTSGIEEAPQLLLSVLLFYHIFVAVCKPLKFKVSVAHDMSSVSSK